MSKVELGIIGLEKMKILKKSGRRESGENLKIRKVE